MHDHALINKVIDSAQILGEFKTIYLEVGELCTVSEEEIKASLEQHSEWEVKAELKKSKIKCKCGYEGRARILDKGHGFCLFNCPQCDNNPEVIEGDNIKIVGVE